MAYQTWLIVDAWWPPRCLVNSTLGASLNPLSSMVWMACCQNISSRVLSEVLSAGNVTSLHSIVLDWPEEDFHSMEFLQPFEPTPDHQADKGDCVTAERRRGHGVDADLVVQLDMR
jgi:hypothetical protein